MSAIRYFMKYFIFIYYLFSSIISYAIAPKILALPLPHGEFSQPSYSQEGFCANMLIRTIDGYKPIQEFVEGDMVIDSNNQEKKIISITRKFVKQCIELTINDTTIYPGCDQYFCVLPEHNWIPAKNIQPGDMLLNNIDEYCNVTDVELINAETFLYSLTVEDHIFYIAPYDICVHNSTALMLGASSVYLGHIITINPIIATIGIASVLSAIFNKAYQEYIQQFPSYDEKIILPKEVILAERFYCEQRATALINLKQELMQIKNGLENIRSFCNVDATSFTYQFLQQSNTPNVQSPCELLKISATHEMQLSESQKINLRTLREIELTALEQEAITLQQILACHTNELIDQINTSKYEYENITKEQTANCTALWNNHVNQITNPIALQSYQADLLEEYLLNNLSQKINELKGVAYYYGHYVKSECIKQSTNIIELLEQTTSLVAQYDQWIAKEKTRIAHNISISEHYFSRRGISIQNIRNDTKNALEKWRKDRATQAIIEANNKLSNMMSPQGPNKDPKKDNEPKKIEKDNKNPNGIYKDAPYHHQNSKNNKSQCPNNGQKCLDYSLPSKGNSEQRIAIENDTFIVLRKTREHEFHGYTVTWEELHWSMQNVLREYNVVTKSGKIIKDVAKEIFK